MTKYNMKDIKVDFIGNPGLRGSFSQALRGFAVAIGEDVDLSIPGWGNGHEPNVMSEELTTKIGKYGIKPFRVPDLIIRFEIPSYYKQLQPKQLGYLPWGTSKLPSQKISLPSSNLSPDDFFWPGKCNLLDGIISPSVWTTDVLTKSGVTVPVLPLGGPVDTSVFYKRDLIGKGFVGITHKPDGTPIPKEERRFVIGMVADWNLRKNIESFLKSSLVAVPPNKAVIALKTFTSHPNGGRDAIIKKINNLKTSMKLKDLPPIILIDDPLNEVEMADFYNSLDVYVCTSRAEGVNLALLEAMACECTVIASGCSCNIEYLKSGGGIIVPVSHDIVSYEEDGMYSSPIWYQGDMVWSKLSELELLTAINAVFNITMSKDLTKMIEQRKLARKIVEENYSINAIRQKLLKHIRKTLGD